MQTNYRVLIVDDIPHNVEILETSLEDKYVLETAGSGEEAMEKIPTFRPDLILLDIMMPGIDGYEVCKQIKDKYVLETAGSGEEAMKPELR